MKDVVINLLKQELKNAQENLKLALEENAQLVKNLSSVTYSTHKENDSKNQNDLDALINDLPFDTSLSSQISANPQETIKNSMTLYDQLS